MLFNVFIKYLLFFLLIPLPVWAGNDVSSAIKRTPTIENNVLLSNKTIGAKQNIKNTAYLYLKILIISYTTITMICYILNLLSMWIYKATMLISGQEINKDKLSIASERREKQAFYIVTTLMGLLAIFFMNHTLIMIYNFIIGL